MYGEYETLIIRRRGRWKRLDLVSEEALSLNSRDEGVFYWFLEENAREMRFVS